MDAMDPNRSPDTRSERTELRRWLLEVLSWMVGSLKIPGMLKRLPGAFVAGSRNSNRGKQPIDS